MAATSIHCCLNASPPNPSPTLPKPTLSPRRTTAAAPRKEAGWRGRCVSTVACVILGSAVGLAEVSSAGESFAAHPAEAMPAAAGGRMARWSDVRECPPWRANSLENIVPENLPRPSPRRRSESVRISRSAPAVAGGSSVGAPGGGCYSL